MIRLPCQGFWREKQSDVERGDLSGNLKIPLGVAAEDLNRRWYEAITGLDAHWLARRSCLLRDRYHFSGVVALELFSAAASVPHQE